MADSTLGTLKNDENKRTCVYYGGAFDPIRADHTKIIEHVAGIIASNQHTIDNTTLVIGVTDTDEKQYTADFVSRAQMVLDAIYQMHTAPNTNISKFKYQFTLPGSISVVRQAARTWDFIANDSIFSNYDEIILVVGTDEYKQLIECGWEHSMDILANFKLWVIDREGKGYEEYNFPTTIDNPAEDTYNNTVNPRMSLIHVNGLNPASSSTLVRERLRNNLSLDPSLLNPAVARYISKKHLYTRTDAEVLEERDFIANYDITKYPRPSVTSTIVPVYSDGNGDKYILMIKRKDHPYKGMWAFPGGFLDITLKETVYEAAKRELEEETSITVDIKDLELIDVYSDVDMDPRGRIVDNAFKVLVKDTNSVLNAHAKDDAATLKWFKYEDIPLVLAFHHRKILEKTAGYKAPNHGKI